MVKYTHCTMHIDRSEIPLYIKAKNRFGWTNRWRCGRRRSRNFKSDTCSDPFNRPCVYIVRVCMCMQMESGTIPYYIIAVSITFNTCIFQLMYCIFYRLACMQIDQKLNWRAGNHQPVDCRRHVQQKSTYRANTTAIKYMSVVLLAVEMNINFALWLIRMPGIHSSIWWAVQCVQFTET